MLIALIILGLLILFILFLLVRGILFKPEKHAASGEHEYDLDENLIAGHLSEMIKCETVSSGNDYPDGPQFEKFRQMIKEIYPVLHSKATQERVGQSGILYHIKGQNSDEPSVLMGHYDVVPADAAKWEYPPFCGEIVDGVIRGRGTLDTKCTVCSVLEAMEYSLKNNFVPKQDIWLSFSGDEEVFGSSCPDIVNELISRGVKPAFVLDEGGAIVRGAFPGVSEPTAMIGIAEKGSMNIDLVINGKGGHAATPPSVQDTVRLAAAIRNISKHHFKGRLTAPVLNMFDILGRHSSFGYRVLFANIRLLKPLFSFICLKSGGELDAMVRSTTAVTMFKGSDSYNVIPSSVSSGLDIRLLSGDTTETAAAFLKKVIKDEKIEIKTKLGNNPSAESRTDCDSYKSLNQAIDMTWPGLLVSPYLMMACSDSRHFSKISDKVYRFSGMELSAEERAKIHGINECIPVWKMKKTVQFYINLIGLL